MDQSCSLSRRSQFILCITYVASVSIAVVEFTRSRNNLVQRADVVNVVSVESSFLTYHNYSIHRNVISPRIAEFNRISQILHISADLLDEEKLEKKVENWNAPISLSVVLNHPQQYLCIVKQMKTLSESNDLVEKHLSVHLIFPSKWSTSVFLSVESEDCEEDREITSTEIPTNMAKNVARMFCSTKYILIADFDSLFSADFEEEVLRIAQQNIDSSRKRVLVYRSFEIDEVMENPRSKADLHLLFSSNSAIVADGQYCTDTQKISTVNDWFTANASHSGILIENMKYLNLSCCRQFVALANIPINDETFSIEYEDDTVLGLEVCRAGYKFDLLTEHFSFYKEFTKKISHSNSPVVDEVRLRKAVAMFRDRMTNQYPNTERDCPDLDSFLYSNDDLKNNKN